jgi:L,D-transpeptidase catalytic domain
MSLILVACSLQGPSEERALAATAALRMALERAPSGASRTEELPLDGAEAVPVPSASGPVLAALRMVSPVYATPNKHAEKVGYLRIGARVPRSDQPVTLEECPGGWYALRPLGFVCAGDDSTIDLEHPLARAIQVEPDRSRPLPYAYAFTRSATPNYLRVPAPEEQLHTEPRPTPTDGSPEPELEEVYAELGANDVPLGPDGLAIGPISSQLRPGAPGERFGGNARDNVPWWLAGERRIPNFSLLDAAPQALFTDRAPRRAGVALIDSFVANEAAPWRRFAVSSDGRLLPADKLAALSGSTFHGESLRRVGLPVAFGWKHDAQIWNLDADAPRAVGRLARRQFVPLNGTVQTVDGVRFVQARSGRWLRSEDVRVAVKPRDLPDYALQGRRWIDVSLVNQVLVLWEGDQPSYATLVSTGRDGWDDPKAPFSTPQGSFEIQQKHVTTTLEGSGGDSESELRDVPWVMYFNGSYALHGTYWHDDFGRMRSHGSVSLAPIDARYVFEWSSPVVPEHWHGSYVSPSFGRGTQLRIRL